MSEARFALYFAPEEDSALARFGWGWLGRRADRPEALALPQVGLDSKRQAEVVAEAGRYGFHATLKPPFRLAEGADRQSLRDSAAAFAAERRAFAESPFVLAELQGFLAIRPAQPSPAITLLADDCVRHFDRFRAPAGAEERRKRLAQPLTDRQKHYVETWGYPYVFEEFRFHMTLSCRLDDAERAIIRAAIQILAGPALEQPVVFGSLCLFEQARADAPFVLAERFPFGR
jgi:putative phosphonate metabolism protein